MSKYLSLSGIRLCKSVFLASLMVTASAKATTVFDSLGLGSETGRDLISGLGPAYASFTSAGIAQNLTGLTLDLYGSARTGTLTIDLYSDSNTYPGALIATLATKDDSSIAIGYSEYSWSFSGPLLAANTRYWIGLADNDGVYWAWTSIAGGGGVADEYIAHTGVTFPNTSAGPYMMQVTTAALPNNGTVPDAGSTGALMGLAVAGLFGLGRKVV